MITGGKYFKENVAYIDKYVLNDSKASFAISFIKVGHLEDLQSRLMDIIFDDRG